MPCDRLPHSLRCRLVRNQLVCLVDELVAVVAVGVVQRARGRNDVVNQDDVAGLAAPAADLRGLGAIRVGAVEAHVVELGVGGAGVVQLAAGPARRLAVLGQRLGLLGALARELVERQAARVEFFFLAALA